MAEESTNTQSEQQLVVFDLAHEAYGVDIGTVREIIRMQDVTSVPHRPDYVSGVINLRGRITPVVDLRKRFDLAEQEITRDSRIVVVDIGGDDIGMIVDAVTEVLRISTTQIKPPSTMIAAGGSDYIVEIAKLEELPASVTSTAHPYLCPPTLPAARQTARNASTDTFHYRRRPLRRTVPLCTEHASDPRT